MTLSPRLLEVLRCPKCKGAVEYEPGRSRLVCRACQLAYEIRDGIPIMLIDEATPA
ncbi:hypothetical protein ARNL5_01276 [Anaerolineae bacterium]|nr:hypothetical protein ARNL5_01276 [Anaerolineae bacterium]